MKTEPTDAEMQLPTRPKVAIFGFSYKKNTSDTRCTPGVTLVARLARAGFHVAITDPQVTQAGFEVEMIAQGHENLLDSDDKENQIDSACQNKSQQSGKIEFVGSDVSLACKDSSAVAIFTEWDTYKTLDYEEKAASVML